MNPQLQTSPITRSRKIKLIQKLTLAGLLLGILAFAAYSILPFTRGSGSAGNAAKPNIIYILFDDATREEIESLPNVKELIAKQGATFERYYTTQSACCPSRASILTGQYVHNHRVQRNNPPRGGYQTFKARGLEARTIAMKLRQLGYKNGYFGKYLNGYGPESGTSYHVPNGWDNWFGTFTLNHYNYDANVNGAVKRYGSSDAAYVDRVITNQAKSFINRFHKNNSVFAFVSVKAPHSPYSTPREFSDRFANDLAPSRKKASFNERDVTRKPEYVQEFDRLDSDEIDLIDRHYRARQRMLLLTDKFVGDLVKSLEKSGQLKDTYIFVSSDNGWMQGEHRLPDQKIYPYEESVHMPLIVRGPGVASGIRIPQVASAVDIMATFTDIAGKVVPADGRSFLPLLKGDSSGWRSQILIENMSKTERLPNFFGLVDEKYKYIEYDNGEHELYDLSADPYETKNLYQTISSSLQESLRSRLAALQSCQGDSCRSADSLR